MEAYQSPRPIRAEQTGSDIGSHVSTVCVVPDKTNHPNGLSVPYSNVRTIILVIVAKKRQCADLRPSVEMTDRLCFLNVAFVRDQRILYIRRQASCALRDHCVPTHPRFS